MKKCLRPSRLYLAAALLLVLILAAPSRLSSAAPLENPVQELPYWPRGATGFVNLTIWQDGLGYDGVNWVQFDTDRLFPAPQGWRGL